MNPIILIMLVPILAGMIWVGVFVARNPVWAAYIFLATQPFVGGIDRGKLIPLLRPSEAIQFGLMGAVLLGALIRACQGERMTVRITKLDRAVVILCLVSSLWPLCWLFLRHRLPSGSDIFSTVVLWRLAGLYALFRWVVKTPEQVRKCLWILLVSASLLSMLAILDSLGIFRLGGIWAPAQASDSGSGRGGATLNSAIAVGDYLSYSLAVASVWILRGRRPRVLIAAMAGIIFLGVLGTGQFSAWFELVIVVFVVARTEGQMRTLLKWLGPAAIVGTIVAWPVVSTRLSGFGSAGSSLLPQSWQGRIDNLTNFYIPRLAHFRWVLGIRPDTVLPAPETWRDVIYLESGYLWLFWVGGIPLVLAFLWLLRNGFRVTGQVAKSRADDIGVAAVATRAALWCLLILSLIDPHLTLRGGADLFFCLLGLTANQNVPPSNIDAPPEPPRLELVHQAPDDFNRRRLSQANGP